MASKLKIALRACAGPSWFGGVNYINNLGFALLDLPEDQRPELWILSEESNIQNLEHYVKLLVKCKGLAYLGKENPIAHLQQISCVVYQQHQNLAQDFDAIFPLVSSAWDDCPVALSWIPDFQHLYYPEFFSQEELDSRNYHFKRATRLAPGLILSSQDAKKDLEQFDSNRTENVWVLPFHSKLEYKSSLEHCLEVRKKFNLLPSYICCINQFWTHKDHETLFKALAILKSRGIIIPLVCTGGKSDYRNASHYQYLMSMIEHHELDGQIKILGHIEREDQIQIIRASRFVVQPSLFEGWSTVLEDCRSLGKVVLASDLGVHYEQNPIGMKTFHRRDPVNLSIELNHLWNQSSDGPDLIQEQTAIHHVHSLVHEYAHNFCHIVKDFKLSRQSTTNVSDPIPPTQTYPKISVVTPNFNQGQYLEKCIQSVLNQGYPNLEYIIIDGGSTDNSVEIIKKYADKITYWVSEKDRGQSHAINKGLAQSTGQIWTWLNGDDWYEDAALFRVAETFQQNPNAAAWVGACHRLHDNGWLHYVSYPNGLYKDHLGNNWNCRQFYQPSCFLNRQMVVDAGGLREDLHFTMDIDLFLKLASKAPFAPGKGIWSTALAQTDAKTVKQMDKAFAEHSQLDESWGYPRGAENIRKKIAAGGHFSDFVPSDEILKRLVAHNYKTPFEFHLRNDILFVADFSKQGAARSLTLLKEVAETVLERAPQHRILLSGPGVESWRHLEMSGKLEINKDLNEWHKIKTILLDGSESSKLWFQKFHLEAQKSGIPFICLENDWVPESLVDGVNGFVANTSFEFAYKCVLMLIEPSVFGQMSAMQVLNLNSYEDLYPFRIDEFESVKTLSQLFSTRKKHVNNEARIHIFLYSWNKKSELEQTLKLLAQTQYSNYKLFVLNNGSNDGTKDMLDQVVPVLFKEYKIIHLPVNIGAAPARNWLWAEEENKHAEYVAYFDDDVLFEANWLNELLQALKADPKAGVVGAKVLNADGPKTIQHSGALLTQSGDNWLDGVALWGNIPDQGQFDCISERDYVMGCCNLYRTSALNEIGDFDVQFSPSQFDDVDHHLRLRIAGWKVLFHGGVEIRHLRNSGGPRNANHIANRYKLAEKHKENAQKIIDKNALSDFLQKHPWAKMN
jgi:GT2 family glycosyltransferase/glycosyltransferase involved in cell wall biosynthesis